MRRFILLAFVVILMASSQSPAYASRLSLKRSGEGFTPALEAPVLPAPVAQAQVSGAEGKRRAFHASRLTLHASRFTPDTSRFTLHVSREPATQSPTDLELAQTYAPVLYFHEKERYRPQPIDVMLDHARLRQVVSGVEVTLRDEVTTADLAAAPADAFIDLWYGSDNTSGYLNYTAHGSYYDTHGLRDLYPVTAYARVFRAGDGRVAIQYWLFYYFNDWYNKHEGDWEMIQVELDQAGQPARAVYAQHHGGTRRPWNAVGTLDGLHPRVYVAFGSHASYFAGDTLYPQGADVGAQRIEVYDRVGSADPLTPAIQLISDGDPDWLAYAGGWGERAAGDFSGPTGPAHKQTQWSDPFAWGDAQPSDAATWYHRNVRLEIDAPPDQVDLRLLDSIEAETIVEDDRRRQTIVVPDKPQASDDEMRLLARQVVSPTLIVEWPDVGAGNVTRREYDLALAAGSLAATRLCSTCDFVLGLDTDGDGTSDRSVGPARRSVHKVNFNPPDSVVFYLPLDQIAGGLLIALAAAIVPSLAYALGVWWLDRYEKEPVHLLASVFVWGALPGALVAVVARFFVAGVVAPILTETVKAAGILFVFTRYRREFDNVLDGIVYGAMTGVGYAMLINLLTYTLSFLFGGFELLSASVLLDGIAFGLNEAYYAAVTGVGFGVSRWATDRRLRIGAPLAALAVAISLHLFTDFWRDLAVGDRTWLVIVPFLATWAGILAILAIAFLALRREQETIRAHLQAEVERGTFVPGEAFYLATPSRRAFMLLSAARRGPVALARAVKLLDLATHLAYRRRELALINSDPDADATVIDLRRRIAEIRSKQPPRRGN